MKVTQQSWSHACAPAPTAVDGGLRGVAGGLLLIPQRIALGAIRAYQLTISPAQIFLFGPAGGCRYTPSCSVYAAEAVQIHGLAAGSVLAAKRICHCHPWGGCGHDPVPPTREIPTPKGEIQNPGAAF